MASGWANDGAIQDQIDATIKDGIDRAKSQLPCGNSLTECAECGAPIPEARQIAIHGVQCCVLCQNLRDQRQLQSSHYNRRGSKDSQLR